MFFCRQLHVLLSSMVAAAAAVAVAVLSICIDRSLKLIFFSNETSLCDLLDVFLFS